MLLAVDVGNTETVFGLYEGAALASHWRLSSHAGRTADEAWLLLRAWCDAAGVPTGRIDGAVVSSVVPHLTSVFADMVSRHLRLEALVVSADTDTGLEIRVESPRTLGADRICNAVGGKARFGAPLVIVDFGTAITFDVLARDGAYLGGCICLGLKGAAQELHRVAAKLPRVDLAFPPSVVGRTTESGIQAGLLWGTAVMVDGLLDRIAGELGEDAVTAVGTGGMAPLVAARTRHLRHVAPFLTLEGMRLVHERNSVRNT